MRLPLIVVVVTKLAEFLSRRMPCSAVLSTISSRGKGKDGGGRTQLSQRASASDSTAAAAATTCSDGRAATEDGPLWDDDIPLTFIRRSGGFCVGCMEYHNYQVSQTSSRPGTAYGGVSHAPFNARGEGIALESLAPRGQNLHGMGVGLFSPSAAAMVPGAAGRTGEKSARGAF